MEGPPVTSKVIAYIVFGFIFVGFCLILLYIITAEMTNIADIPEGLEEYVFIQRFLNNPECFTYQDPDTLRVYPGIVDLDKFTQENLDNCFKTDNKEIPSFKLTINDQTIQTTNFEFSKQTKSKHILIFKDNKFENAELEIES